MQKFTQYRCALWLLIFCAVTPLIIPTQAQETADSSPILAPRPFPAQTLTQNGVTADYLFSVLAPGQVGLVALTSQTPIDEGLVLFRHHEFDIVPADSSGTNWYALIVVDIDTQAREYPLLVAVRDNTGVLTTFETMVLVAEPQFLRQNFSVPATIAYLTDPEVERQEFARLDAIAARITPDKLWQDNRFVLPIEAEYTSGFGQYRILNETVQTRHTGWDQRAVPGTPVGAMAAGRVAFAGQLDIRGNYIMIDHGWGIYSGYAHLSQIHVERGQSIEQGQIIGMSGNTGRSQGPHLHWEIKVNGLWVDGAALLQMWLP